MSANVSSNSNEAINFLVELRRRLIYSLIVLLLLFAVLVYFANHLYTLLALPLLKFLPQGHLIATQIVSPFFVPFKLAFMASMLLAVPFFLYQSWAFIAPALYGHERRMIWPFLLVSAGLFYAGIAFAYFVIFPMLFHFLARIAPVGVILSPDISEYLDFTIKLLLVFGGLFEIPIIMVLLVSTGVVTRERFIKMRSYAIVGAFIIGMLLAPPDVLSQTVLAVPIWLLYEAGILMSRFVRRSNASV
ncbi:Sec-independent protein translocase protein TatC [Aquicella lusitana]|uniref:Sec-independent protein translocase protein TatC n=1 Tax=Aquicella lusitana TaxID=254246 RepID=A0A370GFI0_9COXI|nr:Sec-independent protein translocase TatC [Aquicella lusitana]VVC74117.1 Sec-independent protein translocase protein TatC [Aquicella lusitana]